jgi:hypothetical protein
MRFSPHLPSLRRRDLCASLLSESLRRIAAPRQGSADFALIDPAGSIESQAAKESVREFSRGGA